MSRRLPDRIEVDDLVVRLWLADDESEMAELIADSLDHLRPWMAWAADEPLSAQRRLRLFRHWRRYWESGEGAVYAIEVGKELMGGCALHRRVGPGGLDIGYWLGRHATGRGLAVRTTELLIGAAFEMEDVSFVQISHSSSNRRSAAVPIRLGFVDVTAAGEPDVTTWRLHRGQHLEGPGA